MASEYSCLSLIMTNSIFLYKTYIKFYKYNDELKKNNDVFKTQFNFVTLKLYFLSNT